MLKINQKFESKKSTRMLIFLLFFVLLILDRAYTLFHFGFVYTDIDQLILWNGATDYSNGIFHEPFFYGQPYNYMLESLFAVPLIKMGLPVYEALPISTTIISLLPYLVLAIILFKKQHFFWAYLILIIPVILPLEYNFLTTISRGFVQSQLFIPLLLIPLLNPQNKRNGIFLFLFSSLCFVANQSSIIIIIPIVLYYSIYHFKSKYFYFQILWIIPFLVIDKLFKNYYKIHPEKILHDISGLKLDFKTFLNTFHNIDLFEYLIPFTSKGEFFYLILLFLLSIITFGKQMKKELAFIVGGILIMLISFAIPKVQNPYPVENAGIFFTVSRFYLSIPILVFLSCFLIFKNYRSKNSLLQKYSAISLLIISLISLYIKNSDIQKQVIETVSKTSFPIAKNQDLITRANKLQQVKEKYHIDIMVHKMFPSWEWNNLFDSYTFYPLSEKVEFAYSSVNLNGDRRSWIYDMNDTKKNNRILLIGFEIDPKLLEQFEYKVIENNNILIYNNKLITKDLFQKLNLEMGNLKPL